MCDRADEPAGRWDGYVRAVRGWVAGVDPTAAGLEDPAADDDPDGPSAFKAWLRERDRVRDESAGLPWCEECKGPRKENEGILHRRLCASCDLQIIEDRYIWPLVARMGRRGARKALKALVKGEVR